MKILKITITIFLYVKFYRYESGKGKKKNSGEYRRHIDNSQIDNSQQRRKFSEIYLDNVKRQLLHSTSTSIYQYFTLQNSSRGSKGDACAVFKKVWWPLTALRFSSLRLCASVFASLRVCQLKRNLQKILVQPAQ